MWCQSIPAPLAYDNTALDVSSVPLSLMISICLSVNRFCFIPPAPLWASLNSKWRRIRGSGQPVPCSLFPPSFLGASGRAYVRRHVLSMGQPPASIGRKALSRGMVASAS